MDKAESIRMAVVALLAVTKIVPGYWPEDTVKSAVSILEEMEHDILFGDEVRYGLEQIRRGDGRRC